MSVNNPQPKLLQSISSVSVDVQAPHPELNHLGNQKDVLKINTQQLQKHINEFKKEFQIFLNIFKNYGKYVRIKYYEHSDWQDIPIKDLVLSDLPKVNLPVKISKAIHTERPGNIGLGIFYNTKTTEGHLNYMSFIHDPLQVVGYPKLLEYDEKLTNLFTTINHFQHNISQHVYTMKSIMNSINNTEPTQPTIK